ncbi:MAG: hypothetical protein AB4041_08615 [Microcystaceae cyanobacterium]
MSQSFILAPRYRLDDESPWLEGVDPCQYYWIWVNGDPQLQVVISGLRASSVQELKTVIKQVQSLQAGEIMRIQRTKEDFILHCVGDNCYAIEGHIQGALIWHLFDKEALESLLMTSHPDWLPSPKGIELGRNRLKQSFAQPAFTN